MGLEPVARKGGTMCSDSCMWRDVCVRAGGRSRNKGCARRLQDFLDWEEGMWEWEWRMEVW